MRPALLFTEAMNAIFTTKEHPDYIAALARRGITDLDNVQIDPWPAGVVRVRRRDRPAHRRAASRSCARRRRTTATPGRSKGLIVHFDLGRNEVIEVIDHGVGDAARSSTRATSPRTTSRCATT